MRIFNGLIATAIAYGFEKKGERLGSSWSRWEIGGVLREKKERKEKEEAGEEGGTLFVRAF